MSPVRRMVCRRRRWLYLMAGSLVSVIVVLSGIATAADDAQRDAAVDELFESGPVQLTVRLTGQAA